MKRTIIFKIMLTIIILIYLTLIIISYYFNFIKVKDFWFSAFLLAVGLILYIRYECYKIDSSFFLGILLLLLGTIGIINYYIKVNVFFEISLYIMGFALSSVANFIKFRQIFHIKIFVFELLCGILLLLYSLNYIKLYIYIILTIITVFIMLFYYGFIIKRNTRKI